jgi:hypothetical protein
MKLLRNLAAQKSETHRKRFVGRDLEVVTLHTPAELAARGKTAALSENFLPIEIAGQLPANRLVRVRAMALKDEGALEATAASPMVCSFP